MTATRSMMSGTHGQLRVTLVAPSGSGKSTAARILQQHFEQGGLRVQIIKLAAPLYRLQARYYEEAQRRIGEESQDQPLLEQIAMALRSINPNSLAESFGQQLQICTADVVINDDLRDDVTDWPYLCDRGFQVIKVVTAPALRHHRLSQRNDAGVLLQSPLDLKMACIPADVVLENNGSLQSFRAEVERLADLMLTTARPARLTAEESLP